MYCYDDYHSPVGTIVLASDEENLLGIWFRHQHPDLAFLKDRDAQHRETEPIRQGKDWLDRYFRHLRPEIGELPITLTGTPFRKRVWQLLAQIPYGETVTYGSLARQLAAETGKPMSAQAVGGAVGHNPLSIVLPCHRVVGADGSLTGYAGGLETKAWLLAHEQPPQQNITEESTMRNPYFENIHKNFGFGCMRLPMKGDQVDCDETSRMVDTFLAAGFNYFDTAHGYLGGKSELALRECLTSRYPRDAYILTNKLSGFQFRSNEEIEPLFESQLEACGVEYFDFYLMHAQDQKTFEKFKACRAYEKGLEFLAQGRIHHFGISFHDKAAVLEQILTEYPQVEVVQIQLNYLDFEDPVVESRKCLEVCRSHGKPAIIMEPVKGGSLVDLPEKAKQVFDALGGGSYASYAIRFAAGQEGVMMVLSGMGNMAMMEDNISYMKDFQPLTQEEQAAVDQVCAIIRGLGAIPCTGCRYCMEVCPQGISIPDLFACMNAKKIFNNWNTGYYYKIQTKEGTRAKDCLQCGACEGVCPQHLSIRELLQEVSKEFDQ